VAGASSTRAESALVQQLEQCRNELFQKESMIVVLAKAADQRLRLIEQLHAEAEHRLHLIHELTAVAEARQRTIEQLTPALPTQE
jgi:hypothetical protein